MTPKLFFQSSMPRSGSTLLQNILAQNPAFYCTPTSGALELVFGARLNYTNSPEFKAQDPDAMKKAFHAFCNDGLHGYFRALTDKPCVIDKSRGWGVHFDLLQGILGHDPKIICMVRDLRQILSSMEKKFRARPDKHRPVENHAQMTGTTTPKRMIAFLQSPPVGLALDRLREVHQRGFAEKMLFVRFEDLCSKPQATMQQIYAYLGEPSFEHNFHSVEQITHEDDTVFGMGDLHNIRSEVRLPNNDYLEILGPDAVRHLEQHHAWYFQRFGYAPMPA